MTAAQTIDFGKRKDVDPVSPVNDEPWESGPPEGIYDDEGGSQPASQEPPKPPTPAGVAAADVIAAWRSEGPLVHEPTGLATLDDATGGGPVYGSRWYILGAPDAGKTALLVQIGHAYAARGIFVGFYAVDEEPGDLVTRLAQRIGYSRQDCETRAEDHLRHLAEELATLPIRFYDDSHTVESAAADLHAWATASTPAGLPVRCALFEDSVQSVSCVASRLLSAGKDPSPRMVVSENVRANRAAASRYRMLVCATCEMNRNAYRNAAAAEESNDMAAAAESRAVEYSGRVLVSLRSVADEPDAVAVGITKNKHGRSGGAFYLTIDRGHMHLVERAAPEMPDADEVREAKATSRTIADAAKLALVVSQRQGIAARMLRAAAPFGHARSDAAIFYLESAGAMSVEKGTRTSQHHYLHGDRVPPAVLELLSMEERASVGVSRPPVTSPYGGES
jgi:hypothetical protein